MADLPPSLPSDPDSEPQLEAVRPHAPRLPLLILAAVVAVVLVAGTVGTWLAPPQSSSQAVPSAAAGSSAAAADPTSGAPSSATPSPAAGPSGPPTGTLAIIDAAGALSTMDDRAGSVVPYPVPGVAFQFPTWSPDGSHIAAIGLGPNGTGVYVFRARTTGSDASDPAIIYQSTDRPPFYLYWAPGGRQVTFLTTEPDGIALRIAPADAAGPGTTLRQGAPMYWAFVDGSRMLVHSGGEAADAFLGEVGVDGAVIGKAVAGPGQFRSPTVSLDGLYRAYSAPDTAAVESVVVEGTDGSGRHKIPIVGPAAVYFGPTGDSLAFVAADTQGAEAALPLGPLRIVDAHTGAVRTLLKGSVVGFFWSPDGRTIAALRVPEPGDDKVASAGRAVIPVVARPAGPPVIAAAAAPGTALGLVFVDVATGTIRSRQTISLADTFVFQVLPYFDQYALSHRFWSPDSRSIALPTVTAAGVSQLFVFSADGQEAQRVADAVSGSWSPQALHPGG